MNTESSEYILKLFFLTRYCGSFIIVLEKRNKSQGGSFRAKHHSKF